MLGKVAEKLVSEKDDKMKPRAVLVSKEKTT